ERGLRALVGGAHRMKPQRRLAAFGERIGYPLAETELAALKQLTTTTTLGTPARCGLEHVGHPTTIRVAERSLPAAERAGAYLLLSGPELAARRPVVAPDIGDDDIDRFRVAVERLTSDARDRVDEGAFLFDRPAFEHLNVEAGHVFSSLIEAS